MKREKDNWRGFGPPSLILRTMGVTEPEASKPALTFY